MKHWGGVRAFGVVLLVGLGTFGRARSAHASPNYPALLSQALKKQLKTCTTDATGAMVCTEPDICVPLCTACHNTTTGGPKNINPWGGYLMLYGVLGKQPSDGHDAVGPAVTTYFTMTPPANAKQTADTHEFDADGDGVSDREEILNGDSPSLPAPRGQDQFCPDIRYGCAGGRVAAAHRRNDHPAWFAAGLVALVLSAAMRRRSRLAQSDR